MNTIFLGIITGAIVVAMVVFIFVMLELRKAIKALQQLSNTIKDSLEPTVVELQETLKSVRNVADNYTEITEDIRTFSGSLKDIGGDVRRVSGGISNVVGLVDGFSSLLTSKTSGLKAGIQTGIMVFFKNLISKFSGQ